MLTNKEPKEQKEPKKFLCEKCDFKCFKKSSYQRHLLTLKHNNVDKCLPNVDQNGAKGAKPFQCICGKFFSYKQSLSHHNKKCNIIPTKIDDNMMVKLVIDVVKSNTDMQKQVLDIFKNGTMNMNNSHNHSHNKTFNLQFFLNETCKDAMNIMDFVKDIKINVSDLEDVGKLGYVDGISNIIVKNLKELDVSKRPLHCSDIKREVLYVKDQDKWQKEDVEKEKLRYAIKHIAHKNIQVIPDWKKENPEYTLTDGYSNDQFMKIVMESMGGYDKKEEQLYQNKIISKLAKHVIIEKD
jgi:hypothetical protein